MLAAAMLACATPAVAQPVEPGEEGDLALLVKPEHGARACFSRIYDAAHLNAHPRQTVTEMHFRLSYYKHEPDQNYPLAQRNYYFKLLAKRRGDADMLSSFGECTIYEGKMGCGVDCDGGGVGLSRAGSGRILIDLTVMGRLRMTNGCGEGDYVDLEPGEDDKTFLLGPTAECPPFEEW
jgi:hypothetical protein